MTTTASSTDWIIPGAYEVAPNVHRIPLPLPNDGLRAVNIYVLVEKDGIVLIDSGWAIPKGREVLNDSLRVLGYTPGDIRRFLITHIHRDHYTQAIDIRREFNNHVSMGSGEQPNLFFLQVPRPPVDPRTRQLRLYGASDLADQLLQQPTTRNPALWQSPDEWLDEGALVLQSGRELNVIETPGHTRGHVVFHDESAKLLFAGDHVLSTITPSIGHEAQPTANPLGDYLRSLARIRELPDAVLLPAHGPVRESVHRRVDELIDHHGLRLDETEAAVARGATTAFEVAEQLKWTRRLTSFADLDLFNQVLAVGETGAHLSLLMAQSRVRQKIEEGTFRYSAV